MRLLAFIALFLVSCAVASAAEPVRVWTDSTGQHKIEASFVRLQDENAVLKKRDNKIQTVPLDKLSKADQEYIKKATTANPDKNTTSEPSPKTAPEKPAETVSQTLFDTEPEPLSLRGVREVPVSTKTSWSLNLPTAAPLAPPEKISPVSFPLGKKPFGASSDTKTTSVSFDGKKLSFLFTENARIDKDKAAMGISRDEKNVAAESFTQIVLGDLLSGKFVRSIVPQRLDALALSPDGSKALFVKTIWDWKPQEPRELYAVQLEAGVPKTLLGAYIPFEKNKINHAEWIDNDSFLIRSGDGMLIAVDAAKNKVLWQYKSKISIGNIVLSPDRRFAISFDGKHCLFDVKSGAMVGQLAPPEEMKGLSGTAFSPDGAKITLCGGDHAAFFDTATGKLLNVYFVERVSQLPLWLNDDYVLASKLIHLESKVPVWKYDFFQTILNNVGSTVFAVDRDKIRGQDGQVVYGVSLPHSAVTSALNLSPEQRYAVSAGTRVAVHVDASIKKSPNEIEQYLRKLVADNGWVLDSNAPIGIEAKLVSAAPVNIVYKERLGQSREFPVTYTPTKCAVNVLKEGKVLWSDGTSYVPNSGFSDDELKDSTPQELVNKNMANMPYHEYFLRVKIPKEILNTDIEGHSQVSKDGIK